MNMNDNVHELAEHVKKIIQNDLKSIVKEKVTELMDVDNDNNDMKKKKKKKKLLLLKELNRLLGHTQHCIQIHFQKHASLRVGLKVLKDVTWPNIWKQLEQWQQQQKQQQKYRHCGQEKKNMIGTTNSNNKNKDHDGSSQDVLPFVLLQHFFLNLLRLHDGLILLTSGECRHKGDLQQAHQTKFPSRLPESTTVYHAHLTYSGASWDEWNDPYVGLQSQWKNFCKTLQSSSSSSRSSNKKPYRLWTKIILPYLEPLLNHMDTSIVQADFLDLVHQQVVPRLKTRFSKVKLSLQDKMEEFKLFVNPQTSLHFQRRGKQLQIQHVQGVLPLPTTTGNDGAALYDLWIQILAIPSSSNEKTKINKNPPHPTTISSGVVMNRKKRRIIHDDDDEEEDDDDAKAEGQQGPNDMATRKSLSSSSSSRQSPTSSEFGTIPGADDSNSAAHGLIVNVKEVSKKSTSSTCPSLNKGNASLDAIKQRMGVDVQALAQAHEAVQAEEAAATSVASPARRQQGQEQQQQGDLDAIAKERAEKRVKHLRLNLQQIRKQLPCLTKGGKFNDDQTQQQEQQQDSTTALVDHYSDLWDAQEVLREALMMAGNALLWSEDIRELKKAHVYFDEAAKLVLQDQTSLLQIMSTTTTDAECYPLLSVDQVLCYHRNLLLLAGRAETNCGIVQINQWQQQQEQQHHGRSDNKTTHVLLTQASQDLKSSRLHAQQMHQQSLADLRGGNEDAVYDELRALELESLTCRWLATSLWYQRFQKSSWEEFQRAASLVQRVCTHTKTRVLGAGNGDDLFQSELQLRAECYYSWMTAFDLASADLVQFSTAQLLQEDKEAGTASFWLLETSKKALMEASKASLAMEESWQNKMNELNRNENFMDTYDVLPSKELLAIQHDFCHWWKEKRNRLLSQSLKKRFTKDDPLLQEKDGPITMNDPITSRRLNSSDEIFTVASNPTQTWDRRRKKSQRHLLGGGPRYSNIRVVSTNNNNEEHANYAMLENDANVQRITTMSPTRYCKWGDELLPQTMDPSTGAMVPLLQYPSVPPAMPPEVAAIAQRIGHPLAPP